MNVSASKGELVLQQQGTPAIPFVCGEWRGRSHHKINEAKQTRAGLRWLFLGDETPSDPGMLEFISSM
jgi:hypothetical protein